MQSVRDEGIMCVCDKCGKSRPMKWAFDTFQGRVTTCIACPAPNLRAVENTCAHCGAPAHLECIYKYVIGFAKHEPIIAKAACSPECLAAVMNLLNAKI